MGYGYCGICDDHTNIIDGVCEKCGTDFLGDSFRISALKKDIELYKQLLAQGKTKYGLFDEDLKTVLDEAEHELKRLEARNA